MDPARWRLLEEQFEAALELPPEARRTFVAGVADPELRSELASLLQASAASATFLEDGPEGPARVRSATLEASSRLGVWRIVRHIGHGGMGEVYEVQRADGQFEQRAALKLTRLEAAQLLERFNAERQILARLDHPGIARLLDGGVAPDGRPFAVMEYVEGLPLTQYCDVHHSDLRERLDLFLQVCDAVAYAHRNLIVHRDIKPGNVLVATDRRTKLLDFGIAKPLDEGVWPTKTTGQTAMLLTPDYAAPEQLAGEPVTTATDVYALGQVLFELLVGRRPWMTQGRNLAQLLNIVLNTSAPRASEAAAQSDGGVGGGPVPPRLIEGDLDAIIAKCLRREPQHRYPTVNALKIDIERSLQGDPVLAREDARLYVFGRFMRRYRWAAAAIASIIVVLSVGIAATAWQAARAGREARRAEVARDFLISVFRESDPQIARDRPAGEITAKELLDDSVDRIEKEFAGDPETLLRLLGVASDIYGYWLDDARFNALLARRVAIARQHFGPTHPVIVESAIVDAWSSIYAQDYATAQRRLGEADRLIVAGGHEGSLLRAQWWLARAEAFKGGDQAKRIESLDQAVALYGKLAPQDPLYAVALANSAVAYLTREDYVAARERNERAIAVFLQSRDRNDGDLAMTYANLARSLQNLRQFEDAERAYEQFATLMRRTHGLRHGSYWQGAADHARLVHMLGERERAHRMFDGLLKHIDPEWKTTTDDVVAREYYAERLAAEGRAAQAIPMLEAAERSYIERPLREYDLRRVRQTLGDAYDRIGRADDARRALEAARDERMQKDSPESVATLSSRERWARFLQDHGEAKAAADELAEVIRLAGNRNIYPLVLAHADLAQGAIDRRDAAIALRESQAALSMLEKVDGLYDVRIGPRVWRVHAAALALNGNRSEAGQWRMRALEASRRYDSSDSSDPPDSPDSPLAASSR